MSGDKPEDKDPDDPLTDGGEELFDLDEWGKEFDDLHEGSTAVAEDPLAAEAKLAKLDSVGEFDAVSVLDNERGIFDDAEIDIPDAAPQALGGILGSGPMSAAPTDDEIFGDLPPAVSELEIAPLTSPSGGSSGTGTGTGAGSDFGSDEATSVASAELLQEMAGATAALFGGDDAGDGGDGGDGGGSPEENLVSLDLDDEFYDDIEIGGDDGPSPELDFSAPTNKAGGGLRTAHIVRREPVSKPPEKVSTPKSEPLDIMNPDSFGSTGFDEDSADLEYEIETPSVSLDGSGELSEALAAEVFGAPSKTDEGGEVVSSGFDDPGAVQSGAIDLNLELGFAGGERSEDGQSMAGSQSPWDGPPSDSELQIDAMRRALEGAEEGAEDLGGVSQAPPFESPPEAEVEDITGAEFDLGFAGKGDKAIERTQAAKSADIDLGFFDSVGAANSGQGAHASGLDLEASEAGGQMQPPAAADVDLGFFESSGAKADLAAPTGGDFDLGFFDAEAEAEDAEVSQSSPIPAAGSTGGSHDFEDEPSEVHSSAAPIVRDPAAPTVISGETSGHFSLPKLEEADDEEEITGVQGSPLGQPAEINLLDDAHKPQESFEDQTSETAVRKKKIRPSTAIGAMLDTLGDDASSADASSADASPRPHGPERADFLTAEDSAPELPEPVFSRASIELHLDALSVAGDAVESVDSSAAMARELAFVEREIDLVDDAKALARLHLHAGRIQESLGDSLAARSHFEFATEQDARLLAAHRGLRRVAQEQGDHLAALAALAAERDYASSMEERPLSFALAEGAQLAELQDLHADAIASLDEAAGADARGLLLSLDRAVAGGNRSEMRGLIDRLAEVLGGQLGHSKQLGLWSQELKAPMAEIARGQGTELSERVASMLVDLESLNSVNDGLVGLDLSHAHERNDRARQLLRSASAQELSTIQSVPGISELELGFAMAKALQIHAQELSDETRLSLEAGIARCVPAVASVSLSGDEGSSLRDSRRRQATNADPLGRLREYLDYMDRDLAEGKAAEVQQGLESVAGQMPVASWHPQVLVRSLDLLNRTGQAEQAARLLKELRDADPAWVDGTSIGRKLAWALESVLSQTELDNQARESAAVDALAARESAALASDARADRYGALLLAQVLARQAEALTHVGELQLAAETPEESAAWVLARGLLVGGEEAEAAFVEAMSTDPLSARAFAGLAFGFGASHRWDEWISLCVERAESGVSESESHALRFRAATLALELADDPNRAAEIAREAIEQGGDRAFEDLASAADRKLGRVVALSADRLSAQQSTHAGGQENFVSLLRAAEVQLRAGEGHSAVGLFRKAAEDRPDHPAAKIGYILACELAEESAALAEVQLEELRAAETTGDNRSRAQAYEELARIDEDVRGDSDSAAMSWISASKADAARSYAHHVAYTLHRKQGREADAFRALRRLWMAMPDGSVHGQFGEYVIAKEASLGLPSAQIIEDASSTLVGQPGSRIVLFELETRLRSGGMLRELADAQTLVSGYFSDDRRASAAFHCRAGEVRAQLDSQQEAAESFRQALEKVPTYRAAQEGLLRMAITQQEWKLARETCQSIADSAVDEEEKISKQFLVGVLAMERELSAPDAIAAFRKVLSLDPGHEEAYLRLRMLFDENGADGDLHELFRSRLNVAESKSEQVEIHLAVADLARNLLEDRELARQHLRSALSVDPMCRKAIRDLADVAWEVGAWTDAAEALIARARSEKDPQILRQIFFRLGTIYSDHIPDPRWAVKSFERVLSFEPGDVAALGKLVDLGEQTANWKLAVGAQNRLIQLATSKHDKVAGMTRLGELFQSSGADRVHAERALRGALELAPESTEALAKLVVFYADAGDARSARIHVDRVCSGMRKVYLQNFEQVAAGRSLKAALLLREKIGVRGSLSSAGNVAAVLSLTGAGTEEDQALLKQLRTLPERSAQMLAGNELNEELLPRGLGPHDVALMSALGAKLSKMLGGVARQHGLGRGNRLKRGGHPAAAEIERLLEPFNCPVELYQTPAKRFGVYSEMGSSMVLALGEAVLSADRPERLRFAAGRAAKLASMGLAPWAQLEPERFGLIYAGVLRQFLPEFKPAHLDPAAVDAAQSKVKKLVSGADLQQLQAYAISTAGPAFDYRRLWLALHELGDRAGLLLAGDLLAALEILAGEAGQDGVTDALAVPTVSTMIQFAVSDDHSSLSARLA